MITATYEEFEKLGFQKAWKRPDGALGEYLGLVKQGILIFAKQIEEKRYVIHSARDAKKNQYDLSELNDLPKQVLASLDGLMSFLEKPDQIKMRWIGIEPRTRESLYEIAKAPLTENIDSRVDKIIKDSGRYSPKIKGRIDMEIDAALTYRQLGKPEEYIKQ
ncbi:MAG: hypothetical protein AABX73_03105 [Nanoarchaeota archaeon]